MATNSGMVNSTVQAPHKSIELRTPSGPISVPATATISSRIAIPPRYPMPQPYPETRPTLPGVATWSMAA